MSNTTKPVAKINLFPVTAAIWRNETAKGAAFSVTLQKRYRDGETSWKNTDSLHESDLLLAAKALDLAHTEINKLKTADRQAEQSEGEAA